ncbi:zinc finger and SCAN domain-containing protein 20-like [Oppia nitens]|uniref:zinc finger and SCAN domain-containing protein 20-like n=1 Tax=Oppia nitens TaxID=1686743 RepID=UPI0023D99479|nr:zinc finger and SCAN domain-containing protein 20-like [Oppia nitens]
MGFSDTISENESKIMLICELCNYKSNRKSNFDRHMKSMHEECQRPFVCCGQVFINKASLKSHSKAVHRDGYRCNEESCNKVFPRKALLRRHQTVHNGIKEFSCGNCMYETSHKSNLERHCFRVHNMIIGSNGNTKTDKNIDIIGSPNDSQYNSRISCLNQENSEISSSQESMPSSDLYCNDISFQCSQSSNCSVESSSDRQTHQCQSHTLDKSVFSKDYIKLTDDELQCHNKKLRLCLHPYKCLICWLLFDSQLDYFEHQLLTDHMLEDKDQLEVIRAAAVLTQFRRAKSRPVSGI